VQEEAMSTISITIDVKGPVTVNYGFAEEDRDFIRNSLSTLLNWRLTVDQALVDLEAEVAENSDVTQSAITLITGLKTALDEAIASNDMAKVVELRNRLDAQNASLAAAVAANTPGAPSA
jgi:hypothetical protein